MSDNVYSLINYLSFAKWLYLGLAVAVLPYMRWKRPDLERPFTVSRHIRILLFETSESDHSPSLASNEAEESCLSLAYHW